MLEEAGIEEVSPDSLTIPMYETQQTLEEAAIQQNPKETADTRPIDTKKTSKARNPIIVTMHIMNIVGDALKHVTDKTKEAAKLQKRMWKYYSDNQSENFMRGQNCQQCMMGGKLAKMALDLSAPKYKGQNIPIIRFDAETTLNGLGTVVGGYSDNVFLEAQNRIQTEDAKFQFEVGHSSTDYQQKSQQTSSDEQQQGSAGEKGIQLSRLMAQLITGQPA